MSLRREAEFGFGRGGLDGFFHWGAFGTRRGGGLSGVGKRRLKRGLNAREQVEIAIARIRRALTLSLAFVEKRAEGFGRLGLERMDGVEREEGIEERFVAFFVKVKHAVVEINAQISVGGAGIEQAKERLRQGCET